MGKRGGGGGWENGGGGGWKNGEEGGKDNTYITLPCSDT